MVSVTFFKGGDDLDPMPNRVEFGGTLRAFTNIGFSKLLTRIEEVRHFITHYVYLGYP